MSCGGVMGSFRLLDRIVGWDVSDMTGAVSNIVGLDDPEGLGLARLHSGAQDRAAVAAFIPPPWLAPGCGPCEWYLATPAGSTGQGRLWSRLLRLDACGCEWQSLWPPGCTPLPQADISGVAVSGHRIAIAGRTGGIALLDSGGARVIVHIPCPPAAAMAFGPGRALLAACGRETTLRRYDPVGTALPPFAAVLPEPTEQVTGMAVAADGSVWLTTTGDTPGTVRIWRAGHADPAFTAADIAAVSAELPGNGLLALSDVGFCLPRADQAGAALTCCWSRYGRPLDPAGVMPQPRPEYQPSGSLLTEAIDSGLPRCVWHRVQIDADLPAGTSLSLAVASADAPGTPHPADWQVLPGGAMDALIQQPPGRYLYLRLSLASANGLATPRVRRIRLDFPRATSLDLLPGVYRQNPEAADFSERFLALFDASIADLDTAIARAPALLDAGGVPEDVLPWLAGFLGVALDPAWPAERARAILRAIPELYRCRGTVAGFRLAFRLVFDAEPIVEELGPQRRWGALGRNATLRGVRLFGRNRGRTRLGRSTLGATVLKSYGDPAADPLSAQAWRINVLVPPLPGGTPPLGRIQALVEGQKPAHTTATVRLGGGGFVLGPPLGIGIDTVFLPLPAPVLGQGGTVRLNRASVLRRGRSTPGPRTAAAMVVGLQAMTE